MQNINFSKQIYQNNVFKGCIHIIKRMQSKVSEDQFYRIDTERTITPEIPALLLKMGFDLNIFLSDDGDISNSLLISCKNSNTKGHIKFIGVSGPPNSTKGEEYKKAVQNYLNSKECNEVLKRIERCLG